MLIEIEGLDASGKSTLAGNLGAHLIGKGYRVLSLGFPDHESITGRLIRQWLSKGWTTGDAHRDAITHQCLQIVNRLDLLSLQRWEEFDYVVVDRYMTSGLVYGTADGLDWEWLLRVQDRLPRPDVSFFVRITVEESFKRKPRREDRYEESSDYLKEVAELYNITFDRLRRMETPTHYFEIDGTKTKEEVLKSALDAMGVENA